MSDNQDSVPNLLLWHSHNVGFVHSRDLRAPFLGGVVKGELGNALRLGPGDDLQALDDSLCTLDRKGSMSSRRTCHAAQHPASPTHTMPTVPALRDG